MSNILDSLVFNFADILSLNYFHFSWYSFRPITAQEYLQEGQSPIINEGRAMVCVKLWKKISSSNSNQALSIRTNEYWSGNELISTLTDSNAAGGAIISESEFSTETAINIYEDTCWRQSHGEL